MKTALAIFLLMLAAASGAARNPADTMTGVFDESLKTLRVGLEGDDFAAPVIVLGTRDRIQVSFDRLHDDREFLRYSLTHCDAAWRPDGLTETEFLDGFNEGTVDDFEYSRATVKPYVHYSFTIPNGQVRPTVSGNYLLKIYPEDNPDSIYAQCRFMVSEATAPVSARVSAQTDVDYNKAHQQLSVAVDTRRAQVDDRFNDLRVVIGQNGRLDSEVTLGRPLRVSPGEVIYEHQPALIFEAGNEYRRFETVNERYPGMGVEFIEFNEPYYHFALTTDSPRNEEPYSYDSTQNGRFTVRRQNAADSDTEAEYVVVHFSLDMPEQHGSMIILDGDFTDRRFDDNARMYYNHASGRYERAMLLKQGSYNYQYLLVPPGARRGYTAPVEGDRYQTADEYFIRVYHRRRGERYDRLVGTALVRSDM